MLRIAEKNGFGAPSWAAKIALFVFGILSGGVVTRTAVPVAAGAISSAVPRFWAAIQSWLAPPYLFFAVHLIIFVIWRLSETKQSPGSHSAAPAEEVEKTPAPKSKDVRSYQAEPLVRNPSPEFWQGIQQTPEPAAFPMALRKPVMSPPSDASCVATMSEESSISPVSSGFEMKKSVEPAFATSVVAIPRKPVSEAPADTQVALEAPIKEDEDAEMEEDEEDEDNASIEATWKAIMEKSSRPAAATKPAAATIDRIPKPAMNTGEREPPATVVRSPNTAAVAGVRELPMTIHDEMNQKFDDFIKKHHNQMRLQRHESDQRRAAEMSKRLPASN